MSLTFYAGKEVDGRTTWVGDSDMFPNMSNRNAGIVLETLGYVGDPWDMPTVTVDEFHSKVFRALNSDKNKSLGFDGAQDGNIYSGGIDDNYVPMRLKELLNFTVEARRNGAEVIYWG